MTSGVGTNANLAEAGAVGRRLTTALTLAAVVACADLVIKLWVTRRLRPEGIEAGWVDLRLAYNPGVSFSIGADAPAVMITTVTAAITLAVLVALWRTAESSSNTRVAGMAAVLGGAASNLTDRAQDGVVTDYLHTGWWPTFNLADVAIISGVALILLAELRTGRSSVRPPRPGNRTA